MSKAHEFPCKEFRSIQEDFEDTVEELWAPFGCNALTAPFSQVIYKPSLQFDINDLLSADGELLFLPSFK